MKRSFLEDLGIEDKDQIDKIMAENGRDIERARESSEAELAKLQEDHDEIQKKLANTESKLKDVEELEGELKAKDEEIEKLKAQSSSELQKLKVDSAIDLALAKAGAINPKTVLPLIDRGKLTLSESGEVEGLTDQVDEIKKGSAYLFETPKLKGALPGSSSDDGDTPSLDAEAFRKMTYAERAKLYKDNRELYDKLTS